MRPYLTHGLVPREIDPARRDRSSRPSGWKQCRWTLPRHVPRTVPRRARVIPPIIKLLSCGWHPRATRGTRHCPLTPPPPRPPRSSLYSSFLLLSSSLPTSHSIRSIRLSSSISPSIRGSDAAHVCRERSLFSRRIGIISNWLTLRARIWPRFSPASTGFQRFVAISNSRVKSNNYGGGRGGKNVIGYSRGVARRVRMYSWFFVSSYIIGNNGNVFKKRRDVRLCFNGIVSTTEWRITN